MSFANNNEKYDGKILKSQESINEVSRKNLVKMIIDKRVGVDPEIKAKYTTINDINERLAKYKIMLKELREKELIRIGKEILMNNYERRFNTKQIEILASIVGEEQAIEEMAKYKRQKKVN